MNGSDPFGEATKLHISGDLVGAAKAYKKILAAHPRHADALHLLGLTEIQSGRPGAALPLIRKAIAAAPKVPAYRGNLGTALLQLGQTDPARKAYEEAVVIDPAFADGWRNLGSLCARLEDHEGAARAYNSLVGLTKGRDGQALGYLGLSLSVLCEWSELDLVKGAMLQLLDSKSGDGQPVSPFSLLVHDFTPAEQRRFADIAAAHIERQAMVIAGKPFAHAPRSRRDRLRIGYLSEDYKEHATAYLLAEMLESHDRRRYEIFAYSYGPDDGKSARQRIKAGVEHFVDLGPMNIAASAQRIHNDGIDILVDLKGHTGLARTQILPLRPAPVMAEYIGFPGTFGGHAIDYILADRFVIPRAEEENYSEAVICLPFCYQANDSKRARPESRPAKEEWGLPKDFFVFCSFNNSFKITAQMFGVWLELLAAHPDSVLWLLDFHPKATATLRRIARERGIDPARLVFAPRLPQEKHLARIGAADLFLDTYPCGAHTTASDALWTGVPLVTMEGRTFASRVAGSLLTGLGMPQFIARDIHNYKAIADHLAGHPDDLQVIRGGLEKAVKAAPVFDGKRMARDIERAYEEMWRRFENGEKPESFEL